MLLEEMAAPFNVVPAYVQPESVITKSPSEWKRPRSAPAYSLPVVVIWVLTAMLLHVAVTLFEPITPPVPLLLPSFVVMAPLTEQWVEE